MHILKGLKENGTVTLKSGTAIYSYLPRPDRTIRLTSGMMMTLDGQTSRGFDD